MVGGLKVISILTFLFVHTDCWCIDDESYDGQQAWADIAWI